jgi:hypothetical protein
LVSLIALTDAMVAALRAVPELVDLLGGDPNAINAYLDQPPERNSLGSAIYRMKPGSVLAAWQETFLTQGEMEGWLHRIVIFVRAARGESSLDLIGAIINGIPVPGDGLRWRFCPLMDGVLPTTISEISRPTDEEGIDYFSIMTETKETGDA